MSTQLSDISLRQAALIAGFGLLFMFISGLFGSSPDSAELFDTVMASKSKLRTNIVGNVFMLVFDVVAAIGLYVFLKPINKSLSLLAAWFRLLHVAIYGAALVNLLLVLDLLNGARGLAALSTGQLSDQIMFFLRAHEFGFRIGLVFFGFHILLLGYLIIKSVYIPKRLGILLVVVAFGYLINSVTSFIMPAYEDHVKTIQLIVFVPAIIGELSLCTWLLWKGGKVKVNTAS